MIMNTTETSSIGKIMEVETTEAEARELRNQGFTENEIPEVGTKRRYIRSRHIVKRSEQQIKVEIYLNGNILDFLNERSDESCETQINSVLRNLMKSEKPNEVVEIQRKILSDNEFLRELKDKLKAA